MADVGDMRVVLTCVPARAAEGVGWNRIIVDSLDRRVRGGRGRDGNQANS